ncbi:hypothetical protein X801_04955 [Opisthorchis viverrini]|uniref:Reverse transcriptase domain-containing protein n=1 Tax=Opisthorchis viverrini TaxID=6198 RepID=A0A1S8WXK3_OPIVI|nr:hypothetical protein X801_04955 [Opisthorchis viverrini]
MQTYKFGCLPNIKMDRTTFENLLRRVQRCPMIAFKDESQCKTCVPPKEACSITVLPVLGQELLRLQNQGVIEPVNHSEWTASIAVVRKPSGNFMICASLSTSPNAILNGGKYFVHLDPYDAWLQVCVSDESKHLLTTNTYRELFQCNPLPLGLKFTTVIFQKLMDTMLGGLSFTVGYLNGIIITGFDL